VKQNKIKKGHVPAETSSPNRLAPRKAWEGRFTQPTDPAVERFTSSFSFDRRLFRHDIRGSVAHAGALMRAGLLTAVEHRTLVRGLVEVETEISREVTQGTPVSAQDEDIHMHVERRLTEKVGPVGGKIHTGRSRNDQVALDLRLYLREETDKILLQIDAVQQALVAQAEVHIETILPGYTHLQRAQPVSLAHLLLAYHEMLERDRGRLTDMSKRLDQMPLGSGALSGDGFGLDRVAVARALGFRQPTANSLDAVSDRDFVAEFLSAASILMMHLSRWAEEWILWTTSEFGFIDLPDAFCTGSSMMPQKKNPDVLELIRGKTGRVFGSWLTLLTVMKGLPLSYNRDLQEDKEPLFDTVDTLHGVLDLLARMVPEVHFNTERMRAAASEGFLLATDLADHLTAQGMPFREAHHVVGRMVRRGAEQNRPFSAWTPEEFLSFSPLFCGRLELSLEAALAKRSGIGGTSIRSIRAAIRKIKQNKGAHTAPSPPAAPRG
jgi:argininosuccinate lyase